MASMTRKTRTRVTRREGVMESLCSDIYGASSLATRCGLVPPYLGLWKYQYSELGKHFLQNWLGQGTILGPDEPTDIYWVLWSIMHEHMSTVPILSSFPGLWRTLEAIPHLTSAILGLALSLAVAPSRSDPNPIPQP
jgi:hypothetical protein